MAGKALALLAAGSLAAGGTYVYTQVSDRSESASVEKVVDGDTLDVTRDGQSVRIRLLNVNTPETVDPNKPPECGGTQASEWLKKRLPVGATVNLSYDIERQDRYGRDLAWVTAADGGAVNEEIARNGLGEAVSYDPNHTHFADVQAAQEEARTAKAGLHDPTMECTLPAKVTKQVTALEQVVGNATSAEDADLAAAVTGAATVYGALKQAENTIDGRMLGAPAVQELRRKLDGARTQAEKRRAELKSQADAQKRREAEQRGEADQRAAEQAAQREAQQRRQREAERQATRDEKQPEAERQAPKQRRTDQSAPAPTPAPSKKAPSTPRADPAPERDRTPAPAPEPAPTPKKAPKERTEKPPADRDTSNRDSRDRSGGGSSRNSGGGDYPGYTGPRCYEPGGKVWHPC